MDKDILEIAAKIKMLRGHDDAYSRKIEDLSEQIKLLKENIRVLKADKIVTVASEYRRSKQNLDSSVKELVLLAKEAAVIKSALSELDIRIKNLRELAEKMGQGTGKLLVGNFKDNQENGNEN